ncbi:MAG: hypothetical protein R8K50_01140 [Mariprofundus sp.]
MDMNEIPAVKQPVHEVTVEWGKTPDDDYGYASEADRLEKRGLDDWEMVELIPASEKRIPKWFYAAIIGILVMAFGLSMPFWGDRPGHARPWFTMGHLYALLYFIGAACVIFFMTRLYSNGDDKHRDSGFEDDDIDMPSHANTKKHRDR